MSRFSPLTDDAVDARREQDVPATPAWVANAFMRWAASSRTVYICGACDRSSAPAGYNSPARPCACGTPTTRTRQVRS